MRGITRRVVVVVGEEMDILVEVQAAGVVETATIMH